MAGSPSRRSEVHHVRACSRPSAMIRSDVAVSWASMARECASSLVTMHHHQGVRPVAQVFHLVHQAVGQIAVLHEIVERVRQVGQALPHGAATAGAQAGHDAWWHGHGWRAAPPPAGAPTGLALRHRPSLPWRRMRRARMIAARQASATARPPARIPARPTRSAGREQDATMVTVCLLSVRSRAVGALAGDDGRGAVLSLGPSLPGV